MSSFVKALAEKDEMKPVTRQHFEEKVAGYKAEFKAKTGLDYDDFEAAGEGCDSRAGSTRARQRAGEADRLILGQKRDTCSRFRGWHASRGFVLGYISIMEPVTLTTVSNENEAEAICGSLRSNGVGCSYGKSDMDDGTIEVVVDTADLEKGQQALDRRVNADIITRMVTVLNTIQPDYLVVTASPDTLWIHGRGTGSSVRIDATWAYDYLPGVVYAMDVEQFAISVLDAVQELMIEGYAYGGWPPVDPKNPERQQSGSELPQPGAEVVKGELRWWFGKKERRSLILKPVPLLAADG